MDIEFDFKGDPIGGVITNCKYIYPRCNQNYAQWGWSGGAGGYQRRRSGDQSKQMSFSVKQEVDDVGIFLFCVNLEINLKWVLATSI